MDDVLVKIFHGNHPSESQWLICRFVLHQVAPKIKAMMMESGTTMVGYQPQGNKVNFFRMVISNPAVTQSDIDFLIDEIERLGHDL